MTYKKGGEMTFAFKVPRSTSFRGQVSADGVRIVGTLTQGKGSTRITFDRIAEDGPAVGKE